MIGPTSNAGHAKAAPHSIFWRWVSRHKPRDGEQWARELDAGLSELGKTAGEAKHAPKGAPWKIALARRLRERANAPYRWLAQQLQMGAESSVRAYLSTSE